MNENPLSISDEQLVAYLDGELDGVTREALEQQLDSSALLRQRLAGFEQSWNLLDQLPAADVHDQFATTTVSLVAGRLRRGRRAWGWIAAGLIGFIAVALPLQIQKQRRLRDLPVIQNLELYRIADNIEFLRMLESEGLFVEDVDDLL